MAPYKATNAIIVVGSQSVPNEYVLIIKQHKQDKYGETSGILSILLSWLFEVEPLQSMLS